MMVKMFDDDDFLLYLQMFRIYFFHLVGMFSTVLRLADAIHRSHLKMTTRGNQIVQAK